MDISDLSKAVPVSRVDRPAAVLPEKTSMERAAIQFEAVFLAEMLRHTGLGEARDAFGGGAGEEAFSGMIATEWANILAEKGGIGLADRLLQDLQRTGGIDAGHE